MKPLTPTWPARITLASLLLALSPVSQAAQLPNQAPEITPIPDLVLRENSASGPLAFLVADPETAFEQLVVRASSSNPDLLPATRITLAGTGFERTLSLSPTPDTIGTTLVTLTVSDAQGLTTATVFHVTVTPVNQRPTLSTPPNQVLDVSTYATLAVPFIIGDAETAADNLKVSATSSDSSLVPASGLALDGSGAYRVLRITPTPGVLGETTIELAVTDANRAQTSIRFSLTVTSSTTPAPLIDFNGDKKNDLLFQHKDGFLACAFMDNGTLLASTFFDPPHIGDVRWHLAGAADLNHDGNPDLIFQRDDSTLGAWIMDGIKQVGVQLFTPERPSEPGWRLAGIGDLYGDGSADFFFQHDDGRLMAWVMNGATQSTQFPLNPPGVDNPAWRLAGVADLNGDRNPDLIFQHQDGTLGYWLMDGARMFATGLFTPSSPGDPGWKLASIQDTNGDGRPDLIFQHTSGFIGIWTLRGTTLIESHYASPANPGADWSVAGPR